MKKKSRSTLADQVRELVINSKLTQHQIARDTGVKQPGLSKFMNGGSLKIETLDTLLEYLEVELYQTSAKTSMVKEPKRRYGEDSIEFGDQLEGLEGKKIFDDPYGPTLAISESNGEDGS